MKYLFTIFPVLVISLTSAFGQRISLEEVQTNIGKTVTVCGKISGGRFIPNAVNTPTLLYMGTSASRPLTLVIFFENLKEFPAEPEVYYANKQVCVTGTIANYKGQPEMILNSPNQIKPDDSNTTSSANIPRDTANKITGINISSSVNRPGITSGTAANKPSGGPVATPDKTPNSVVTGSNTIPKGSGTANKPAATAANTTQYDIKITQDVYMRSGPSFDFPLVTTVKAGSVVTILSSSNGWSQVAIKDKDSLQGYIKNSVLK